MENQTPYERLARARELAGFQSATDAARFFGWNENTYRSHENGERGLKPEVVRKYARAFHSSPDYILFGSEDKKETNLVPLIGSLISERSVDIDASLIDASHHKTFAKLPISIPNSLFSLEVLAGVSGKGFLPGNLIICWSHKQPIDGIKGMMCLVERPNGNFSIDPVYEGKTSSTVMVISENYSGLDEFQPKRLHGVFLIVPPHYWRRVDDP